MESLWFRELSQEEDGDIEASLADEEEDYQEEDGEASLAEAEAEAGDEVYLVVGVDAVAHPVEDGDYLEGLLVTTKISRVHTTCSLAKHHMHLNST